MPDYAIWSEHEDRDNFQVFEGATPQAAMESWAEENDVRDGDVVYARDAKRVADGEYEPVGEGWSCEMTIKTVWVATMLRRGAW